MRIQDFNPVIKEDNEISDVVIAHGLVCKALDNVAARQEYFDYMTHLRNKHGKEYSTRIHQKATALAKSVDEDRNHKIIDAPEGLGGLLFYRKINGVEFRLAKFKNTRGNYIVYVNRKRYDYDTFEEAKAELSQFIKSNKPIDESIYSDNKPKLIGLSFADLDRLSESAGDNFRKFDRALQKNLNLPKWTNTLETYGVYLRKLTEHKAGKLIEGMQSEVEQTLFDELSGRADGSIKSAKVGDTVALLHLATLNIPGHKVVAKLNGFLNPKEIVNITSNGPTQQLEFSDGSRYPDKDGGDIFQQTQGWNMTKLFPSFESASKAYTFYGLIGKKMSAELDFDVSVDASATSVTETIVKVGSKYELKSRTGKNLGKYPTRAGAERREQQVNYFKHVKEDAWTGDNPAWHNGNNQWNDGTDQWHSADDGGGTPAAALLTGAIPIDEDFNPQDVVSVDVPLLIRLLEYAREDAKTDMDLHNVTERLIALSQEGATLTMQDYETICNTKETN